MATIQDIGHQIAPKEGSAYSGTSLDHLKAIVLLGGSVRANRLNQSVGRSILDLPLHGNTTVFDHWESQISDLAQAFCSAPLYVRVVIDHRSPAPEVGPPTGRTIVRIERDPVELRGTAGLLRDLTECYDDDDWILAASALQVPLEPLHTLAGALAETSSDISLISHEDGTPSSLMLIKCGCLRSIPRIGFEDMKEQALPRIAASHRVSVVRRLKPTALPISTHAAFIRAVRTYHQQLAGDPTCQDPFEEDWNVTFSLVEDPDSVDETAQIYDSVVLRGSRVKRDAVLVRSIVCPGAILPRRTVAMDRVVSARAAGPLHRKNRAS